MGLQVWLPLNGNLNNQGLNGNFTTLSYNNLTSQSSGKTGSCYSGMGIFHQTSEFLSNSWSIALWVKASSWAVNNDILLCKNTSESTACQFYFSVINGKTFNVGVNAGSSTVSYAYTFNTNEWYHLAATFDGKEIKMYINGICVKTVANNSSQLTGHYNLGVGCRSTNAAGTSQTGYTATKYYNDVRIYDHCLSPLEVKEIAKGLVMHYPLNDASSAYDCSGFENDGEIVGTGSFVLSTDTPRYDKCVNFNGASNLGIKTPLIANNFKPTNQLTMALWVNPAAVGTSEIDFFNNYEGGGIGLILYSGKYSFQIYAGGYKRAVSSTAAAANTWAHVVGTYDGANIKVYVNGELKGTTACTTNITYNATAPIVIGYNPAANGSNGGSQFNGKMSDARVYATALSADDVLDLYHTAAMIDNKNNIHTYEFKERDNVDITKQGIVNSGNFITYNDNIKTLSDGSVWYRIMHHNNPASNLFTTANCWNNRSENLYSCMGLLKENAFAKVNGTYEFLACEKTTSSATEQQYRWSQTSNPATSSTLTGYVSISNNSGRSIGLMNKGTYGCFHNGGSWWCCCGSYTAYQGGIPGFGNVVTTGYIDLYIRIPGETRLNGTNVAIYKNAIASKHMIEI